MAVLYNFPERAAFGKIIPKSKIYEHTRVSNRVKKMFATEVERIWWAYKLAPETINLPEKDGVREIQVFEILLKTETIHDEVLRVIDRAIPSPIIFILSFNNRSQYVASYKRISKSDSQKWVIGACYFKTDWMDENNHTRVDLPVVLDMATLYKRLLENILPVFVRPGEDIGDFVKRGEEFKALSREADKLRRRLKRERQFNRKVEINRELRKTVGKMEQIRQSI